MKQKKILALFEIFKVGEFDHIFLQKYVGFEYTFSKYDFYFPISKKMVKSSNSTNSLQIYSQN